MSASVPPPSARLLAVWPRMLIQEILSSKEVEYSCPAQQDVIRLVCLWRLDTEQGAEGQLSPMCSLVTCSRADACEVLASGSCPLTEGYDDVLNSLGIRVLQGHPVYMLGQTLDSVVPISAPAAGGHFIWFGRTSVLPEHEPRPNNPFEPTPLSGVG